MGKESLCPYCYLLILSRQKREVAERGLPAPCTCPQLLQGSETKGPGHCFPEVRQGARLWVRGAVVADGGGRSVTKKTLGQGSGWISGLALCTNSSTQNGLPGHGSQSIFV